MLDLKFKLVPVQVNDGFVTSAPPLDGMEVTGQLRALGAIFEGDVGPWGHLSETLPYGAMSEIRRVILGLSELHGAAFGQPTDFFIFCLLPNLSDPSISGSSLSAKMSDLLPAVKINGVKFKPGQKEATCLMMAISAACAFAVQALRSESDGEETATWGFVCKATEMLGLAQGIFARGPGREMVARGKKGSAKRHEKTSQVKQWTVTKYNAGSWKSANQAAHELQAEVQAEALRVGATLSAQNLQRTIAGWIRESKKSV